jgi:hypothetical protein
VSGPTVARRPGDHAFCHVFRAGVHVLDARVQEGAAGAELQFATNHLGHFALAVGLHDALAAAGGARLGLS